MGEKIKYNAVKKISDYTDYNERMAAYDARVEHFEQVWKEQELRKLGDKALRATAKEFELTPEEKYQRRVRATVRDVKDLAAWGRDAEEMKRKLDLYCLPRDDREKFEDDVLHRLKEQKYGEEEKKGEMKFYYSLSREEFENMLKDGQLSTENREDNPFAKGMELQSDYRDKDGKLVHNTKAEDDAKQQDKITLVLDTSVIDEKSFLALGENPSINAIDLRKDCLAIIDWNENESRKNSQALRDLLEKQKVDAPFVSANVDGVLTGHLMSMNADSLRQMRDQYAEHNAAWRQEREEHEKFLTQMKQEVFERVDTKAIKDLQKPYVSKVKKEDCEKFVHQAESFNLAKSLEKTATKYVEYFAQILNLRGVPKIVLENDKDVQWAGYCKYSSGSNESTIVLNQAHFTDATTQYIFSTIAHESWHVWQNQRRSETLREGKVELKPSDKHDRAVLYDWNYNNYIKVEDDAVRYRKQLVEQEANMFEKSCGAIFTEVREAYLKKSFMERWWDYKALQWNEKQQGNGNAA